MNDITQREKDLVEHAFYEFKKSDPTRSFQDCIKVFRTEIGYFPTGYLKPALAGYDDANKTL